MNLNRAVLVLMCVSLTSTVRILSWPPLKCSRQDLNCTVNQSNCMDENWRDVNDYTPSSPVELQVSVDTREDETGCLQPVLGASWKIQDDGSIGYLKATELHVLVKSTNQNLCVRYSFKEQLPMRSPSGEKWSFTTNMLVLDPGQRYHVSVLNIPKPELGHSSYDVSADVVVPDCQDPKMRETQFCIERGSLWQPNISLVQIPEYLVVSFSPDRLCQEYMVIVSCSTDRHLELLERPYKDHQETLNISFSLDKWKRSCCQFDIEIKPLFPQCGQDCTRRKRTQDICPDKPTAAPDVSPYPSAALGVVFTCVVMAVVMFVLCRKTGKPDVIPEHERDVKPRQQPLPQPPKVLVIYSQDHHLYRDIVLKLCTFLQAKCGTKVLVDLLDSTTVGMVGRLRWLEGQRQQLKNPSDKILVLCSRGVQAKWRAMCGQGRVTLREDVFSPTDDMLTPFLNLFLPDMHQAGMLGKYMVAYFDDISSERDVPSVFDIAIKYSLMKHFEELFFRILDIEKYQPDQVCHIEGIGGEAYFHCPSGRALRNAIETFQAFQFENPDWFEKECVVSEEEVRTEADVLIDRMQIPPVLECVPLIREGLPVYIHEVEINENENSVHILTPELNREHLLPSLAELTPIVNPVWKHHYPPSLGDVWTDHLRPHSPGPQPVYIAEPILNKPPPRQNWLSLEEEPSGQSPTEDDEENSLLPTSQPSAQSDRRSSALQNSPDPQSLCANIQSEFFPSSEISRSQPVEIEEDTDPEPSGKGPSSGSDQGYISKISSQHEPPFKKDTLVTLARLQEELFQDNIRFSDGGPEWN